MIDVVTRGRGRSGRAIRTSALAVVGALLLCGRAYAQTATLVSPVDGAVNVVPTASMQWTSVTGAQAYVLWLGTSTGAHDIVGTNELQQTSFQPASPLPASQTFYARMWTKVGGTWRSVDSTFTTAALATLVSPANGAANIDLVGAPLQWTSVPNAQAYVVWIGTSFGAKDVVATEELTQLSFHPHLLQLSPPPANTLLYARMWVEAGGVWRSSDTTFTTTPAAHLAIPGNGFTNVSVDTQVSWFGVAGAQAYVVWIGTTAGGHDVLQTAELAPLHGPLQDLPLPPNRIMYVRLWTLFNGVWLFTDTTFRTMAAPVLVAPVRKSTGVDPLTTFQWTSVPGADAYVIWLGTGLLGSTNIHVSAEMQQTSYRPIIGPDAGLPPNTQVEVRLWARVGGVWRYSDTWFTTGSAMATLVSPANGASNVNPVQPLQWSSVPTAQAYVLWLGTTFGASDVLKTGETLQTSYQPAADLPANRTLYARLWTKTSAGWRSADSSFTTGSLAALITSPVNGASIGDGNVTFQWNVVNNAQAYVLWLGTTVGSSNLERSFEFVGTSWWVRGPLPMNQTVYARLWTKYGGAWRYTDSSYTVVPTLARLTYPPDGGTNVDDTNPATWTSVPNAQSYVLWIGTTFGAHDVNTSCMESLQTSCSIAGLPANRTLYARMWTKSSDGMWRSQDSTFSVVPVAPEFIAPLDGAIAVDPGQAFRWTQARNADGYQLVIGSTPGATDVFNSGPLTTTSHVPAGLSRTGALYARVYARINNQWVKHSDIGFTLDAAVGPSTITVPPDGTTAFAADQGFEWQNVPLARGYRLKIGTTFGSANVHDSGEIHVVKRLVSGLPVGVPLFGRLETKIGGAWQSTDFAFTVASNAVTTAKRIQYARWATDFVRHMAFDEDNRPADWNALKPRIGSAYSAVCSDFSAVLVTVLSEMNLGLSAHTRDVAFNTNGVDGHTLVEVLNPDTGKWMLFDPTFDLTVKLANGAQATAEDVSAATVLYNWTAIQYDFLGVAGDAYARGYYLDYPLLFVNVQQPLIVGQGGGWWNYVDEMAASVVNGPLRTYMGWCGAQSAMDIVVDGVLRTFTCTGPLSSGTAFQAFSVNLPNLPGTKVYRVRRFVF